MIINAFIKGQALTLSRPKIVAGSNDYLELQALLQTGDWHGLDIWAHFSQDGKNVYDLELQDGRITRDQHLNLAAGEWKVYFTGMEAPGTLRITTETQTLTVEATGCSCAPFPEVPPTHAEQITKNAAEAKRLAEKAMQTVTDNLPLTERAEAAAKAAESARDSAKTSQSQAGASAQNASRDAGRAATSAQQAETAAGTAKGAAGTATDAANAAGQNATRAETAQQAAAQSAQQAAGSLDTVKADANRASNAAGAADTSRRGAEGAANRAANSETAAAGSAGAAEAAKTEAQSKAASASQSAGQASQSATTATGAAGRAAESAQTASRAAETATSKATEATTQASRAKTEADRSAEAAALSIAHGVTGAKKGDLFRVKEVDEKGVPTALEPVSVADLEGKWELVDEITFDQDTMFDSNAGTDGRPYKFIAVRIKVKAPLKEKDFARLVLMVNNSAIFTAYPQKMERNATNYAKVFVKQIGPFFEGYYTDYTVNPNASGIMHGQSYNSDRALPGFWINRIKLPDRPFPAGTVLTIEAVRI